MAFRNDTESGSGSSGFSIGRAVAGTTRKVARSVSGNSSTGSAGRRRRRSSSSGNSGSSGGRRRISSGSSGGSSRRRSSGGGSNEGRAPQPKPRPAPKIPSLAQYLGTDSAYQGAVRGGKRSLADFLSEIGRRRGEANTQFTQTTASMERDRIQQLEDLRNEFASRGLIQSGLFGEEQGRFQSQFTEQMNALKQQQAALLADLLGQETNYKRENDLALEQAKQEAIARRAARYKIGA